MVSFEFVEEKKPNRNKFLAYGTTLEEVFTNAAQALLQILTNPEKIETKQVRQIQLRAEDPKMLLFDWLEEILRLVRVESFVPAQARVVRVAKVGNQYVLKAKLQGDVTPDHMYTDVRTIDHSDTFLDERGENYVAQVAAKTA